jgi:hypothetical protein
MTRRFVESTDGTFDLCTDSTVESETFVGRPLIKPSEFKTFLKIGKCKAALGSTEKAPFRLRCLSFVSNSVFQRFSRC